jgi:uncharacterized damage-inducible protein DinB
MTLSPEQAKDLGVMFTGMVQNELAITRRVLAAVPDAQLDFKLGDKGRTTREVMWHICTSEAWFTKAVIRGDFNEPEMPEAAPDTTAAMVAWYDRNMPPLLEKVKALSPEHLAREANFFGIANLPMVMYLQLGAFHSVHHRGQLSTYLRAMNAHVPDIYGGSADEPFQMPANA